MPGLETALNSFTNLALRAKIRDDDGIDQLHHFVTVTILAFFAAITGVVEYAGEPINCWNYGDYLWKHFQDHVNTFCWTHSLYHYPNKTNLQIMPYALNSAGHKLDASLKMDEEDQLTFFRWVTVIFVIQAFLFKLPNLLWAEFNAYSGSNIVKMVEMMQSMLFAKKDEKNEKLEQVALFLEQWLRIHRKPHWFLKANMSPFVKKTLSCCTLCVGDNSSNYLSTLYLVTKFVYLLNNMFQFLLLSAFLQVNFWHFGTRTLEAYYDEKVAMSTNATFPTVALCHFQTFDGGNATGKWVQCILTINIHLGKLFLIEWFWLLLLLVITFINLVMWCLRILQTETALRFVQKYMKLMGVYTEPKPVPKGCSAEQFVMEYLRNDGVFVLRILALNTNEVIVAELVEKLWERYLTFEESPHPMAMEVTEGETSFNKDEEAAKPVAL